MNIFLFTTKKPFSTPNSTFIDIIFVLGVIHPPEQHNRIAKLNIVQY